MPTRRIDVHHVTRVEGHGDIVVDARDGQLLDISWQVPEAPRFFEAMVVGRPWQDLQTIVSRICGICSVSHSMACVKGLEAALGIEPSAQALALRRLAHAAELVSSHVLHIGYLAAPDLLGAPSVLPLIKSHMAVVENVVALHAMANRWAETLVGRTTHPLGIQPGRMTFLPALDDLRSVHAALVAARPRLDDLGAVLAELAPHLPDFERETEYVALVDDDGYALYDGLIASTDTQERVAPERFERVANEWTPARSTAKWARWHRESYTVGALARYHLSGARLRPRARRAAEALGVDRHRHNPYYNTLVQLVECVHVVEESIDGLDALLERGLAREEAAAPTRAGEGVGAVEAPRGALFQRYALDGEGRCVRANLTVPTGQNHANIQADMEALVPRILERGEDEVRLWLEMLVRAYDPCVSCSTHFLDVRFV